MSLSSSCLGCFGPLGKVRMHDGSVKLIFQLRKGDIVHGGSRVLATVSYTSDASFAAENHGIGMIQLNNMLIAPYHPVRVHKKWKFAIDLVPYPKHTTLDTVYNFVLDSRHILIVNDIECATLGSPVLFGHRLQDLQAHPSWQSGSIDYSDVYVEHDDQGYLCKFYQASMP